MPEISRFFGIVIRMYVNDHYPPHFHAAYGEFEALINIETLKIYQGDLPQRARGLVLEWAALHRGELQQDWSLARKGESLQPIAPLE
ncbi:MAG: transcriptional regulator [Nitrospirae bacterium RIFCSPLOWO2_02_FULL_62_14]|nr:MAG: transcriptional regulator [Nitrospirae bacterium RIFCSPLOWO2_02_FULL_62_14]